MSLIRIAHTWQGLLHLFYPRLCEGCSKALLPSEDVLCISCDIQLPHTGYHHVADNETGLRFAGRIPYIYATSLAYFTGDGLLQHLLHGLKYRDRKYIGYYLGRKLGNELQKTGWIEQVDVIIPVPLHSSRQASRGYNQSMLIATGMSEVLKIPANDNLLLRTRDTGTQTRRSRTERVANMQDAFQVKDPSAITGRHVLLCDDVLTTGATLEACALAILRHAPVKISISTIGIAVS